MPKLILPQELYSLFFAFAPCFTQPGVSHFVAFLLNFMAGTGRRTAVSAYARSDLSCHWTNAIRWLSRERADKHRSSMAQVLLDLLCAHLPLPRDSRQRPRLYIPVDETRVHKSKAAQKMDHLQYWFNPHGSACTGRLIWGHLWAIVGILLPIGNDGRLRCFPLTARLCPSKRSADHPEHKQKSKNDTSYSARTFFGLLEAIRWPKQYRRTLLGDGAFACKTFLEWCRNHGFFLISSMRLNADVREILNPCSEPERKRGRPRKWGDRIRLDEVYEDDARFEPLPKPLYEEGVEGSYTSLIGVLKRSGDVARIVVVKTDKYKPMAIICTDLSLEPLEVIYIYTDRFEIEMAIRELKDETGFGDYQVMRAHAIERHGQLSIVACALLKLLRTQPELLGASENITAHTSPWKPKRDSLSTSQVRTLLQQACLAQLVFRVLGAARVNVKRPRILRSLRNLGFGVC